MLSVLECQSPRLFKDDIKNLKIQLEVTEEEKHHGTLVRARAEKFLLGEAPTKGALSSEKRYSLYSSDCIHQVTRIKIVLLLLLPVTQLLELSMNKF